MWGFWEIWLGRDACVFLDSEENLEPKNVKQKQEENLREKEKFENFKQQVETTYNNMKNYASQYPDYFPQILKDLNPKQPFLSIWLVIQGMNEHMKKNDPEHYKERWKKMIDEYILIINKMVQTSEKIEYFQMFFKIFENFENEAETSANNPSVWEPTIKLKRRTFRESI